VRGESGDAGENGVEEAVAADESVTGGVADLLQERSARVEVVREVQIMATATSCTTRSGR
jgi:hypothetical protein